MMNHVEMARWGKDHWSMLAYVETLCVDGRAIDNRRVRANRERHPHQAVNGAWNPKYGTRLKGYFDHPAEDRNDIDKMTAAGVFLPQHDDWDCLDNLEAEGLVEVVSVINGFVMLTEQGLKVSAALRAHKASGGNFADFEPPLEA